MDTNDRYTKLCEDLRRLMSEIGYSVPCEPEELMAVAAYDVVALRPWAPTAKDQVEAVSSVLTSLDRRVFLVNNGCQNMKNHLDAMYVREIAPLYRFADSPAGAGTIWKRTLRTGNDAYAADARQWLSDLAEFIISLNEELDELETKLPAEITEGLDMKSWQAPSDALLAKIHTTM